jgi:hypothetical protein
MADETAVDRLYKEAFSVIKALEEKAELSLQVAAADNLRKSLLLAAASHFEHRVSTVVLEFVRERAKGSVLVEQFVRNRAIARQYHTWFNWNEGNANQFFGLFGAGFRTLMCERVKERDQLRDSIRAFLELGNERNRLVHEDYASFQMEKTIDEVFILYKTGRLFVEELPVVLRECDDAAMT